MVPCFVIYLCVIFNVVSCCVVLYSAMLRWVIFNVVLCCVVLFGVMLCCVTATTLCWPAQHIEPVSSPSVGVVRAIQDCSCDEEEYTNRLGAGRLLKKAPAGRRDCRGRRQGAVKCQFRANCSESLFVCACVSLRRRACVCSCAPIKAALKQLLRCYFMAAVTTGHPLTSWALL